MTLHFHFAQRCIGSPFHCVHKCFQTFATYGHVWVRIKQLSFQHCWIHWDQRIFRIQFQEMWVVTLMMNAVQHVQNLEGV